MANYFAHNEMLVHTALCTQKEPKNILIITDNEQELKQECARHNDITLTFFATKTLASTLNGAANEAFDTIIIDAPLPDDVSLFEALSRITTHEGIVVSTLPNAYGAIDTTRKVFEHLGKYFKIAMPFSYESDALATTRATLLFASKFYHPTADIILQRSDLIDGLSYYNSEIHLASFVQSNNVRQLLKGVVRN